VIRAEKTGLEPIKLVARMLAVSPLLPMKELKSNCVGKFVSMRGNVVRVSGIRPLVLRMSFVCAKCNTEIKTWFTDGKYETPTSCPDGTCRSKTFAPAYSTAAAVDWQKVRIQELEADVNDAGRVPRTVEVELSEDLVDSCVPGDVVTIGGIVKAIETDVAAGRGTARAKSIFLLYIDAASVSTQKVTDRATLNAPGLGGIAAQAKYFSEKDLAFISRIKAHRDTFSLVVASCCPNIYGHEMVKAGLLLGLFGGTARNYQGGSNRVFASRESTNSSITHVGNDEPAEIVEPFEKSSSKIHIRCDPHILVVGDPGMGKSQMLQAIVGLAPRGVYVCGNTTTSTGLTVVSMLFVSNGETALTNFAGGADHGTRRRHWRIRLGGRCIGARRPRCMLHR
jgi:DNA helicase MCM8